MTHLRIRLPESLPVVELSCAWALLDTSGQVIGTGDDRLDALPEAASVELLAPASRVLLTQTTLPKRAQQRARLMLRFAIEDRLTVEPERIHAVIGPHLGNSVYAVAAIDREWVASWVGALSAAGRPPRSMLVETCQVPLEAGAWSLVVDGAQGFIRTGAASGVALDFSASATPPALLQLALQEARNKQTAPERLVIHAASHQRGDLHLWSGALGLQCLNAAAWDWKLAPGNHAFELLQGEFAPARRAHGLLPLLRPALIIGSLIVALHVVGTTGHWAFLTYEKSNLQAEMRALFQTSFPDAQGIVDPPLQMHRQVVALRRAAGEPQRGDFLPLLSQAAAASAGNAGVRIKSVTYESAKLLVDVQLSNKTEAEAILQRIKGKGQAAVTLDAVNPKGDGVEARFTLSAAGGA